MELKLQLELPLRLDSGQPFNRTSMELKRYRGRHVNPYTYAFNRTSMELKLIYVNACECSDNLLIEPVWN